MASGACEQSHCWSTRRHEVEGRGIATSLPNLGRLPIVQFLRPLVWLFMQSFHRVRFVGFRKVPREIGPEGMILVSNHASLVDPLILQALTVASVRWMMDRSFMSSGGNWFWRRTRVIPVEFGPKDADAFAEAIAHVKAGGVLGVFPEGGLPRPPRELRPFLPGVGAIVARTKAPVLLVWVDGGPRAPSVGESLFRRSEITVTVVDVVRFEGREARDVKGITARLRERIAAASGWPLNDEPMPHLAERMTRHDAEQHPDHVRRPESPPSVSSPGNSAATSAESI
ncbi:MAG: 1-acyl-sn-glycerol-3-phosphate acyltransferase [Phycisphaerae bacterium]|nr:1-acyl-sn-glycerol-3-phosphate acyltransferase [Phycisphaerae bacterium]